MTTRRMPGPLLASLADDPDEEAIARVRARLRERLARTAEAAWSELGARGERLAEATLPSLEVPEALAGTLAAAIALEEAEGTGRAAHLERHYLEVMPRQRVQQLCTTREPERTLFHTPLDWSRLPRLAGAVHRLYALVGEHAPRALGEPTPAAFFAARPTVAALYERAYYGRLMPLLYGYPGDLALLARALDGGQDFCDALDEHFAAPLVHELSHFQAGRVAIAPPYLDECVAGHIGARALPELVFPSVGAGNALYHAYWFAQVGQALVRCFGDAVVAAHVGAVPWSEALGPSLLSTAARIGRSDYRRERAPHFLCGNYRPERWLKLMYLSRAGHDLPDHAFSDERDGGTDAIAWADIAAPEESEADRDTIVDGLRMMCLESFRAGDRPDSALRARRRVPPPLVIDLHKCTTGLATATVSALDPVSPTHHFPPAVAARLRARGLAALHLTLSGPHTIDAAADAILDGKQGDY